MLLSLCQKSDGQPLAGVVVIGDGHSARAIALAGSSMGLPVLWAKGGTANLDGMHREVCLIYFVYIQKKKKYHINVGYDCYLKTFLFLFF